MQQSRLIVVALAVAASSVLAACSGGSSDADDASSATSGGGAAHSTAAGAATSATSAPATSAPATSAPTVGTAVSDSASNDEQFTPLIITPLGLDPIPVRGTDGMYHVTYELEVLNASPREAIITSVESLADDAQGAVVGSIAGPDVVARTLIVGDYPLPPVPASSVPGGRTVLLLLDDVYTRREDIPAQVVNRLAATFEPVPANQAEFANNFPGQVSQVGVPVRVSDRSPVVIGPPLTGDSWVAVNACCGLSPHRGAMVPVDGRINAAERYAVDWARFDLTAQPIADPATGIGASFEGDPTNNASYFAYDQPLLAVADATVVTVVSDLPDAPPREILPGLALGQLGGSHVVLDLGSGAYAFYAHMKPGSATVEVGDQVRKGQEIGRTGNSGNTTESHLHFHVMDGPLPLTANNLPFEIDHFTFQGTVTPEALLLEPSPGARTDELPLTDSAIGFPDAG